MTQQIGTSYQVVIPTLSDGASIVEALKYYHQGGLTGSPSATSIEQYLININTRFGVAETAIGYPYSNALSLNSRLSTLETTVSSGISSLYVKAIPSSNTVETGRNLIKSSIDGVVPLTIEKKTGSTADLQQWNTATSTVGAKVDQNGKIYSNNGLSGTNIAEVATISGTQTLTNKTISSPTISTPSVTGGTISSATSITLTGAQTLASYRARNIYVSTTDPGTGNEGDIWLKY
jgi:hypothetical protein